MAAGLAVLGLLGWGRLKRLEAAQKRDRINTAQSKNSEVSWIDRGVEAQPHETPQAAEGGGSRLLLIPIFPNQSRVMIAGQGGPVKGPRHSSEPP